MKMIPIRTLAAMSLAFASSVASAQTATSQTALVTVENYNRAQTDVYFAGVVKNGGFGKFRHGRELAPPIQQGIVRPNRDTLYSFAVFDLDAGPVTITLPEGAKRFMAMQVVSEDQYSKGVYYGTGSHTLTRETIGTRYAIAVVRFLADFSNKEEIQQIHALQDAIKFSQEHPGTFQVPNWDEASLKKVKAALLQLGATISDTRRMFGANEHQVDPVKHLIGSAMLWGGNAEKDALYLPITPAGNDGRVAYKLTIKDVPVDGFWSSPSTTAKDTCSKTRTTPMLSTASQQGRLPTALSPFSSVGVRTKSPIACQSRKDGITLCVSFVHGWRFSTAPGNSLRQSP